MLKSYYEGMEDSVTQAENNNKGVLTIDLNYESTAQTIASALHHHHAAIRMLEVLRDKLDIAGMKRGILEKERRINEERRDGERRG